MPDLVYEPIPTLSDSEIKAAVSRNDPNKLLIAVLAAALYSNDRKFALGLCVQLSTHEHFNVRGNAILGLAHIARIDGEMKEHLIKPLILSGLRDDHEYVRNQAESAKEDIEWFLGWNF